MANDHASAERNTALENALEEVRRGKPPVISVVNLGCAKNQVDSERILGQFAEAGFLIAEDPGSAELCLVNTCGFIDEAREETATVLNDLRTLKETRRLKTIVALGCMVERATDASELAGFLAGADARLGFKDYPRLPEICLALIAAARNGRLEGGAQGSGKLEHSYAELPEVSAARKRVPENYSAFLATPRVRIGGAHTAYLKISEGCNNPCRFCSIPRMRGLQVSRPIEELVVEARQLIAGGCKEINLIAQDTTSYGQDIYGRHRLADLLKSLRDQIDAEVWFRLMYAYPKHLDAEMLDVLASDPRFCPYIDLPLQHISDRVLKDMGRGVTRRQTLDLLDLIGAKLSGAAIRTTFIVGYPGETETEFEELLAFVKQGWFTHAGAFLYSAEPMTPAAKQEDTLPVEEKQRRREALMLVQRGVSKRKLGARLREVVDVLIDSPLPKGGDAPKGARSVGRTRKEAPEVDGVVYLCGPGTRKLAPGAMVKAKIVRALSYDLVAEVKR